MHEHVSTPTSHTCCSGWHVHTSGCWAHTASCVASTCSADCRQCTDPVHVWEKGVVHLSSAARAGCNGLHKVNVCTRTWPPVCPLRHHLPPQGLGKPCALKTRHVHSSHTPSSNLHRTHTRIVGSRLSSIPCVPLLVPSQPPPVHLYVFAW
jgi:hypothetical protein